MSAAPKHKPGHRVKHLTFLALRRGGWECECDCGERSFLTHAQIHTRGHCGCLARQPYDSGEESFRAIGEALGIPHKQRTYQIYEAAERKFRRHWTLWRLVMDTDLETADRSTLWEVIRACRILGAALDARAPQA